MDTKKGFQYKPTKKGQWFVGSKKATVRFGAQTLNPTGQWGEFVPAYEKQSQNGVEPYDCTVANSLKAWITLSNFLGFSLPKNASERFNAIMAQIKPPGANPHDVCESIRTWGMVNEDALPFNEDIKSIVDFYHPDPMDAGLIAEAKKIVQRYDLGHEYLFNDPPVGSRTPNKPAIIKSALSRGTVCASVYGWKTNADGLYYKSPGDIDEHWTMITGYVDGQYWVVDDSYEPFVKRLAWDFDSQTAEVYYLQPNTSGIAPNDRTLMQNLLRACIELVRLLRLKLSLHDN